MLLSRCCSALALLSLGAAAQSDAPKRLTFEVASIKPAQPGGQGGGIRAMPGGQTYLAQGATLRLMIMLMYKMADGQVVGGPSWMNSELWDVDAKAERPSSLDQLHEMYQNMLVDRFQLKFHMDTREERAYVMTVDKGGTKMKKNLSPEPFDFPLKPGGRGQLVAQHLDMKYLCWFLGQQLQSPLVNQTGLDGFYDFTLELPPPDPNRLEGGGRGGPPDPSDLFAAIGDQLGLKIDSRQAPVPVMVIDSVQKPSGN
ncbi:MAG TPA: TIGR03435 family protein [Bryobacteraceae bacterium]|nr:TIGR03435 family protein [Bryobacteraceae bacterium]